MPDFGDSLGSCFGAKGLRGRYVYDALCSNIPFFKLILLLDRCSGNPIQRSGPRCARLEGRGWRATEDSLCLNVQDMSEQDPEIRGQCFGSYH